MDKTILNNLLKEYEQKRIKEQNELDERKKEVYSLCPRIEEIDKEFFSVFLTTSKQILSNNNSSKNLNVKYDKLKKEKSALLKSIGKDDSYLKPNFECENCKDTGYVLSNSKTEMCSCLKQKLFDMEYNKSNINNITGDNFDNFNINLYSDKIDKTKYGSSISPRENIKKIKTIAQEFIENFEDYNQKNLMFCGGTGLGKTFMANCIVNELLHKGKTVLYHSAPVMLDNLIAEMFDKTSYSNNFCNSLLNVDLLIIDDLGTETMNSMKFTELYKIINTRLLNQNKITKTIISTNLDLQNLYNTYDERLVSRFVGHYNAYRFFGEDIRFIKR